ncbi:hypothetical protein PHYPO_G00083930 [Pangasianodon hypophthalmus]|uniref:Uncharacterized protein n=1 Tax=Pangasianodon hypophthalmus TaxID=310915 RepID=A0A5N5LM47_PANHP|nr:hypothetical protein PHYPO_G00083930 [Pangasianodon hypophthalmus]
MQNKRTDVRCVISGDLVELNHAIARARGDRPRWSDRAKQKELHDKSIRRKWRSEAWTRPRLRESAALPDKKLCVTSPAAPRRILIRSDCTS